MRYRCVNGHDLCDRTTPSSDCQYCEKVSPNPAPLPSDADRARAARCWNTATAHLVSAAVTSMMTTHAVDTIAASYAAVRAEERERWVKFAEGMGRNYGDVIAAAMRRAP